MKISAVLTALIAACLLTATASAQCSTTTRSCQGGSYPVPYYRPAPVQHYQPVQRYQPVQQYRPAFDAEPNPAQQAPAPAPQIEPDSAEQFVSEPLPQNLVTLELQVKHPLNFEWKTIKTFEDPEVAEAYRSQIEGRYWVVFKAAAGQTKFLEAVDLFDARSKANALRTTGAKILQIKPYELQFAEESFQDLFDSAVGGDEGLVDSPVPNDLQPLLGLWEAVTRDANGELNRILLDLRADGTAEMQVPSAGGGQVTIEREFAVEEGVFKLTGETDIILGNVLEAESDKVVLDRSGAEITFLRP